MALSTKGNTPIIYCDFDGVINTLNRHLAWNDPETKPTELDYIFKDATKWHLEEYPVPNDTHYTPDNEQEAEFHGRNYILQWSSELIQELNDIITNYPSQFIWLTTWKEYTDSLLNDMLGLNVTAGSWLDFPQRGGGFSGKLESLMGHFETLPDKPPFVWLDDVDTYSYENYIKYENNYLTDKLGTTGLIIQTTPDYGISREEIVVIKKFLANA